MENNSEDFRILLNAAFDVTQIKNQLNNIKDLSIKIDDVQLSNNAINKIKQTFDKANIPLHPDFGNISGLQKQAQNIGKNVGELISQSAQKAISGISAAGIGKAFRVTPGDSAAFEQEMKKLVAQWTNNTGKDVKVKVQANTVFDEGLQANVQKLTGAVVTYRTELDEVIRKTIRLQQIGTSTDLQGVAEPLYGFVEVSTEYSKAVERTEQQTQKFINTQKQAAANLQKTLNELKSGAKTGAKPIDIDSGQIKSLIDEANNAIAAIKQSTSQTFTDTKIKAEEAISSVRIQIQELRNEQFAATSLRTKDVGTIKQEQQYRLDTFIAKMQQSSAETKELETEVDGLRNTLNNVGDAKGLTDYLNQLSILEFKFESVEAQAKAAAAQAKAVEAAEKKTNQANKLKSDMSTETRNLQTYVKELQDMGVVTGDTQKKIDALFASLGNVGSQSALTAYR